jgi:hypothetical protein
MVCLRGYAKRTAAWLVKDVWKSLHSKLYWVFKKNVGFCGPNVGTLIFAFFFKHDPFSGSMDMYRLV